MQPIIYLDHAAATPLDKRVFAVMEPYLKEEFYNPSAAYMAARGSKDALEQARHDLAIAIGAQKDEIVLTAGATESIHIAFGVAGDGEVVIGATEHAAVRSAAQNRAVRILPSDARGLLEIEKLPDLLNDNTTLVSVAYADSELGTVQSLRKIADVVAKVRIDREDRGVDTPIYLHTDASQAATLLDLNVARLGVDLMTLNAAKCYGPKQVGLLWIKAGVRVPTLFAGGGQERGIRAGTENVAGAVGFAMALSRAQDKRHQEAKRLAAMRQDLMQGLLQAVPDLVVNGHAKRHLPSHLHVSVPRLDAERVVFGLDSDGAMVATGAACAANKSTRSDVLMAVGMSDELADGSLRLTLGHLNDESQIPVAVERIASRIAKERVL